MSSLFDGAQKTWPEKLRPGTWRAGKGKSCVLYFICKLHHYHSLRECRRREKETIMNNTIILNNAPFLFLLLAFPTSMASPQYSGPGRPYLSQPSDYVIVDQSGNGNFVTIQAAIDAVVPGNILPVTIHINAGIYREKVVVPSSKRFLTFQGAGMDYTIVEWNLKASDIGADGQQIETYNTASVTILAADFVAKDMSFRNMQPVPPPGVDGYQAVALRISGDRAAFYRCGFYGAQDTLCDDQGRHYFEDCFIQGSIDFIFGNGQSLYVNCELNSIAQSYGSIAAQNRLSREESTGFSFVNCKVTGTGIVYLGRAMGPYSRIVYAESLLGGIIDPKGWDDWGNTKKEDTVVYGQYRCSGQGADESSRVPWSHELSYVEAQPFLSVDFVDGKEWLRHYSSNVQEEPLLIGIRKSWKVKGHLVAFSTIHLALTILSLVFIMHWDSIVL